MIEQQAGVGESGDGKAVPVGEDLIVEARRDAAVANRKQPLAQGRKTALVGGVEQLERAQAVENVAAFEVAFGRDAIDGLEESSIGPEDGVELVLRPDIIATLLALGIGIVARGEGAAGGEHGAQEKTRGLFDSLT
jgi:hypothetical protein